MRADAVERVLARVENYPFEIDLLLADSGFYNERVIRRARDIPNGRSRAQEGRAHEGQTRNSQVVHDDLSHVQGQRAGTALPARGRRLPTRTEIEASTARSFVATWRVALLIAQRSRSNTATGSVQASKRPIAYFGKHAGSRRRVIPSCGLPSCWWSRHCWRTCGWCYGGRSSPAHGGRARPARGVHVQDVL